MSIKSTHYVTREFAIQTVNKLLDEGRISDSQLADMLETAVHNGFYNFTVVDQETLEEEKRSEYGRFLDDLDNLPEYNDAY